jgi:hypothetical protein
MNTTNKLPAKPSRTRAHRVLFMNDSPFRSRTVENKKQYRRQPKHRFSQPL